MDAAPPLRVCYFNRSYWPDTGATGQLLTELAEDLVALHGLEVTVVTGYPAQRRRDRLPAEEVRNGVRIIRARGTTFQPRAVRRPRDELRHLFSVGAVGGAAAAAAGRHGRADRSADHRAGRAWPRGRGTAWCSSARTFFRRSRDCSRTSTARSSTRCSIASIASWSAARRASSRSATRWRHAWSTARAPTRARSPSSTTGPTPPRSCRRRRQNAFAGRERARLEVRRCCTPATSASARTSTW